MESALLTSMDSSKKSKCTAILSSHRIDNQFIERLDIPTLRENRGGGSGYQGDLPGGARALETSIISPARGVGSTQPFNWAVLGLQTNADDSSVISDLTTQGSFLSGYTSAGLVFGNTTDSKMPFCA